MQRLRPNFVGSAAAVVEIGGETTDGSTIRLSVTRSVLHAFIIEDDYLISQALRDMLADLGFNRFSFARSEDAAVAGAHGERFDLITADARLLPGDGLKAVETICRRRKVPVIFVTGYPDEIEGEIEAKLPEATIVHKPIDATELAAAVRNVMAAHEAS
jgi:two-component system, response regulator PdtaR